MDPSMLEECARARRVADAIGDLMADSRDARASSMEVQLVTQVAACLIFIARVRLRFPVEEAHVQELATRVMIEETRLVGARAPGGTDGRRG